MPPDGILRLDSAASTGALVELYDEAGERLGLGDLDLESPLAVRRLGLPGEPSTGAIPRLIRRALELRQRFIQGPRFCRVVNDDGDGLPGLRIDRYGSHFAIQTFSAAMEARLEEIARTLVEQAAAESVLLRSDPLEQGKVQRPRVLFGRPPRWVAVYELSARLSVDLQEGTGYRYELRRVRKLVARMARGARVLEPCCGVASLFVHAGVNGAKQLVAFDPSPRAIELAWENAEANGINGRTQLEVVRPLEALEQQREPFDLVLLDTAGVLSSAEEDGFVGLVEECIRHTRRGGFLVLVGRHPPLPSGHAAFDDRVEAACERSGRVAFRLVRPGLPFDFPVAVGSPLGEPLSAAALEVS